MEGGRPYYFTFGHARLQGDRGMSYLKMHDFLQRNAKKNYAADPACN